MKILNKIISVMLIFSMLSTSLIMISNNVEGTTSYYVDIKINSTIDGALTNYPIKLTINSGVGTNTNSIIYLNNHATNWPYDIHFTTNSGTTVGMYRESYSSTIQYVWFNATTVGSSGITTFKLIYGDGASDTSNGDNVFPLYDGFSGSAVSNKWTLSGTGTSSVSNGILTLSGNSKYINSISKFGQGYSIRTSIKMPLSSYIYMGYNSVGLSCYSLLQGGSVYHQFLLNGTNGGGFSPDFSGTVYHTIDFKRLTGTNNNLAYIDNATSTPTNGMKTFSPTTKLNIMIKSEGAGANIYCDWIFIRKCTNNEPTLSTPSTELISRYFWSPLINNSPQIYGKVGFSYSYNPTLNESGTLTGIIIPNWASISNNGTENNHYINGTPLISGNYYFSIKAYSNNGLLYSWKNWSVCVNATWNPYFNNGACSIGYNTTFYSYQPTVNESATIEIILKANWMNYYSSNNTLSGIAFIGNYSISLKSTSTIGTLSIYYNYSLTIYEIPTHIVYVDRWHNSTSYVNNTEYVDRWHNSTIYVNNTEYVDRWHNSTIYVNNTEYVDRWHNSTIYVNNTEYVDRWNNNTIYVNSTIYVDRWHNETIYVLNETFKIISIPLLNITQGTLYIYQLICSQNCSYNVSINNTNIKFNYSTNCITGIEQNITNITITIIAINSTGILAYQNYTLNITYQGDLVIDSVTLGQILWIIFMIVFLLLSIWDMKWGTIGGIIWIIASLQLLIPLSVAIGVIGIGIGMILEVFAIIKIWEKL